MKIKICFVAKVDDIPFTKKTNHYIGLPPVLAGGVDLRQEMPIGQILVIEQHDEGFFLNRFTQDGEYAGDTWHASLDDAREQATEEFGDHMSEWVEVPSEIKDPISFASEKFVIR